MSNPIISLIVAHGENFEIGAKNDLLWHLPDDFRWFVKHTKGKPIIMGRKTMESLPGPLKNRTNIVLTSKEHLPEGFVPVKSMDEAIEKAGPVEEVMIIGGGQVYERMLPKAHRIYITKVESKFDQADTFFPNYDSFKNTYRAYHAIDDKHKYSFEFQIWEK